MKLPKIPALTLAGALLLATSGCDKDLLDQTNPNAPSTQQFWQSQTDAMRAVNAAYGVLQLEGSYGRWIHFAYDLRSDEGYSASPWTDLANAFSRFIQTDYNFGPVSSIYTEHYRGIYRTNQILANVPGIASGAIEEGMRKRLLAEARFLRALYYFNLVSLYGNVPLLLEPSTATTNAPQGTIEQGWAQVLSDLQAAEPDLPASYTGADVGRATKGAAQALMGKVYMQQRKYAEASAQFAKVISSGRYSLVANYLDNFTMTNENNSESVFEVQFSDALQGGGQDAPGASEGNNRAQFYGPRGIGWSDGQPRRWLFTEFNEPTTTGAVDPRRDVTLFNSTMTVYGQTYAQRGYNDPNELFWRKYQNDRTRNFENYHSGINIRVIRYADVLLMQAEALNKLGQTSAAIPLINQVRTRVGLAPLAATFSQDQLHMQIMHERVTELAGEGVRWNDLNRWGLLDSQAEVDKIKLRDTDFTTFIVANGKSKLLPLPQVDLDINKAYKQNPGW